ncbi:MAG TPA: 50S ribosomal protein L6 [Candidatus Thalassarchaeaceae archaeon]|nr:50S ribosomal protein L6 [Candidatus Thalassarchaeaceae archaeon]HJM87718.1 50S ribosomal protein L6 [Candidatus Thalassarchaeaceae archaeon]
MVKLDQIRHEIALGEGVSASVEDANLSMSGPNGSMSRAFEHSKVNVSVEGSNVVVQCDLPRRKEKALCGTWRAHITNMRTGVTDGFAYRLKAVYSHFPMTLNVTGPTLEIKNLFGEKVPRVANLIYHGDVVVSVEGKSDVVVTGVDREKVGQTAAIIERACKIRGRDRRIFQDGIYIVSKGAN